MGGPFGKSRSFYHLGSYDGIKSTFIGEQWSNGKINMHHLEKLPQKNVEKVLARTLIRC